MIDNVPENVANLKDKTYKIKQSLVFESVFLKSSSSQGTVLSYIGFIF
jgi:hypothetical protein